MAWVKLPLYCCEDTELHILKVGTRLRWVTTSTPWGWLGTRHDLYMVERKIQVTLLGPELCCLSVCRQSLLRLSCVLIYSKIHSVSDGDRHHIPLFLRGLWTEWWTQSTLLHEQRAYGKSAKEYEPFDLWCCFDINQTVCNKVSLQCCWNMPLGSVY
jgi:hypothetical protein